MNGDRHGVAEPLRAAARLGPYFAWQPWDGDPAWRPLADLRDPDVLADRVAAGRRTLLRLSGLPADAVPERVVASIVFLGLASRLLSPLLGAATVGGALPVPDSARMWWRPVDGGPVPIAYRDLVAGPGPVAETMRRTAVEAVVQPVLDAVRFRFAVSPQVLWGNVASALGGAAGMIADTAPEHAGPAAAIVERLLTLPPLQGTATLTRPDPGRARWLLRRRNCCLYYRIPGGGVCADCVLAPRPRATA